ncbi:MAG: hypothetical protein ACOYJI_01485 [Anaerovoracaceae bacterium]|jgi:hypothetical protein
MMAGYSIFQQLLLFSISSKYFQQQCDKKIDSIFQYGSAQINGDNAFLIYQVVLFSSAQMPKAIKIIRCISKGEPPIIKMTLLRTSFNTVQKTAGSAVIAALPAASANHDSVIISTVKFVCAKSEEPVCAMFQSIFLCSGLFHFPVRFHSISK